MSKFEIIARIDATNVRSLVWDGDSLIDWAGGGNRFELHGNCFEGSIRHAFEFDAACVSPSGKYAAVYQRLDTKGAVLKNGEFLRELNRSDYHADVYEYPICFARLGTGQEVLIHCPDEYCQLEIEDAETGERLTQHANRKPVDFFHSRLAVNSTGTYLLSAGWVWQPYDFFGLFNLPEALVDPALLDDWNFVPKVSAEVSSASFLGDDRLVIATSAETFEDEFTGDEVGPSSIAVWDIARQKLMRNVPLEQTAGTLMPIDEEVVVDFFEHPKLVSLSTGNVIERLPSVHSGTQTSSIIHHIDPLPAMALDPARRRFAIASESEILVVAVSD